MKLTEMLSKTNSRVGALESDGINDNAVIARITKIYGNIKITATIKYYLHQYNFASENLFVSQDLYI